MEKTGFINNLDFGILQAVNQHNWKSRGKIVEIAEEIMEFLPMEGEKNMGEFLELARKRRIEVRYSNFDWLKSKCNLISYFTRTYYYDPEKEYVEEFTTPENRKKYHQLKSSDKLFMVHDNDDPIFGILTLCPLPFSYKDHWNPYVTLEEQNPNEFKLLTEKGIYDPKKYLLATLSDGQLLVLAENVIIITPRVIRKLTSYIISGETKTKTITRVTKGPFKNGWHIVDDDIIAGTLWREIISPSPFSGKITKIYQIK